MTVSMKIMKMIGDSESPCGTPLCIGKGSESPHTVLVIAFMCVIRLMIMLISPSCSPFSCSTCSSFSHSTLIGCCDVYEDLYRVLFLVDEVLHSILCCV